MGVFSPKTETECAGFPDHAGENLCLQVIVINAKLMLRSSGLASQRGGAGTDGQPVTSSVPIPLASAAVRMVSAVIGNAWSTEVHMQASVESQFGRTTDALHDVQRGKQSVVQQVTINGGFEAVRASNQACSYVNTDIQDRDAAHHAQDCGLHDWLKTLET